MPVRVSRSEVHQLIRSNFPDHISSAIIRSWDSSWRGAELYLTTRSSKLPALRRWEKSTEKAIAAAGGADGEMEKIYTILGGSFIRF